MIISKIDMVKNTSTDNCYFKNHTISYLLSAAFMLAFSYILSLILLKVIPVQLECMKKIVLIIAHPDDEVMFFSPVIHYLINIVTPKHFHVLCITKGEFDGSPEVREKELISSCHNLGIHKENIKFLNRTDFPDHPTLHWDIEKLSAELTLFLIEYNIHTVVTFGPGGVSGHINHCDVHNAVMKIKGLQKLILCDVNVFRKYLSAFDALYTYIVDGVILQKPVFISAPWTMYRTLKSMQRHDSQFVWFRKLYFMFSRYIIVNHIDVESNS